MRKGGTVCIYYNYFKSLTERSNHLILILVKGKSIGRLMSHVGGRKMYQTTLFYSNMCAEAVQVYI